MLCKYKVMDKTMKTILFSVMFFVIVIIGVFYSSSQGELVNSLTSNNDSLLTESQLDTIFKYSKLFPNETEYSIAFINGNFVRYVGIKRQNDSLIFIENSDRIFEIGSITKTFTSTILAKLVYDGKVKLSESIKNLIPIKMKQSSKNGNEITLLHLANHTSGLPPIPDNLSTNWEIPGSPYQYYDENKLYDFLSKRSILNSTPGDIKVYSNLGGGLLGHLLTLITKKSYEKLLFETICIPLKMEDTCVKLKENHIKNLVRGRDPNGRVVPNWDLNVLAGAGEIKSTTRDLVKYIQANMDDSSSFFHLALQPTFQVNDREMMCLGWGIYKLNGKNLYVAFGGTGGYSSGIIFEKTTKTAVILLTNISAFLSAKGDYTPTICRNLFSLPNVKNE